MLYVCFLLNIRHIEIISNEVLDFNDIHILYHVCTDGFIEEFFFGRKFIFNFIYLQGRGLIRERRVRIEYVHLLIYT
jgi:hypothetical protein